MCTLLWKRKLVQQCKLKRRALLPTQFQETLLLMASMSCWAEVIHFSSSNLFSWIFLGYLSTVANKREWLHIHELPWFCQVRCSWTNTFFYLLVLDQSFLTVIYPKPSNKSQLKSEGNERLIRMLFKFQPQPQFCCKIIRDLNVELLDHRPYATESPVRITKHELLSCGKIHQTIPQRKAPKS